jgi:broad specificity phosphatase PhoE
VTLYVLRHARAGRRSTWKGDDILRPLTKVGRRQAAGVVDLLGERAVARIVSSPYVRCRQSVEPLAASLRLPVDLADSLGEGSELHEVLRLLDKVGDDDTVLCTHGDIIRLLLDHLRSEGVKVRRRNGVPVMEKGSVWELETKRGTVVRATYHRPPPPATK